MIGRDAYRRPSSGAPRIKISHLVISKMENGKPKLSAFDKIEPTNIEPLGAVILAPGLAFNGLCFAMGADGEMYTEDSFASFLAQSGYLVYVYHPPYAEGVINQHILPCANFSGVGLPFEYKMPSGLTFEELKGDVPIIIDVVCEDAKTEAVAWVGFSQGGMLILAYFAGNPEHKVAKIALIAAPVIFDTVAERALERMMRSKKIAAAVSFAAENFGKIAAGLSLLPARAFSHLSLGWPAIDLSDLSHAEASSLFRRVIEPTPRGLLGSFVFFIRRGFSSPDGRRYLEQLACADRAQVPNLCIYPNADGLVSPGNAWYVGDALCSAPAIIVGGHDNSILGSNRGWTRETVANFLMFD